MQRVGKYAKSEEESVLLGLYRRNLGEEKPTIGCGSIVKERNESGPAAPRQSTERVTDCGCAVYWTWEQMANRLGGEFRVRG